MLKIKPLTKPRKQEMAANVSSGSRQGTSEMMCDSKHRMEGEHSQ